MDLEKCNLCGECDEVCPIAKVTGRTTHGLRAKMFFAKNDIVNESFLLCTDCGKCKDACIFGIKMDFSKQREQLIKNGFETEANKVMIENIRKYGNPYGPEPDRKLVF